MVPTCETTQGLAERIERAYLRGRPPWRPGCSNPRVWLVAADTLMRLHRVDPAIPADPELFVAAQPAASPLDDPWQVLTQPASSRRYLGRVRKIVRQLRAELRGEIRRGEGRLRQGVPLESVLRAAADQLSPLGRIVLAIRNGRPDLAESWRAAARDQHNACPLYFQTWRGLMPDEAYPVEGLAEGHSPARRLVPPFSMN